MVTAALTPATGKIINLDMDYETAAQHVRRIQEHLESAEHHVSQARNLLWELHERNGWKALNYKSWRACVLDLFVQKSAMLYKELRAAEVEMQLDSTIGTYAERVLRPLTKKGYSPETRQVLWNVAQDLVGPGGKVTSGVVEAVVEGLQDMLASGATQDGEGRQTPLTARMQADLLARVRQVKVAHKEHIRRMDSPRTYILGGLEAQLALLPQHATLRVRIDGLDSFQMEKVIEAQRTGQPIYASLWTENPGIDD